MADGSIQQVIKCIEQLNVIYDQTADQLSSDALTDLLGVVLFMKYDNDIIQDKASMFMQKIINSEQYMANQAQQQQSSLSSSKNFNAFFDYINNEQLDNVYTKQMEMILIHYINLTLPNNTQLLEYQGFKNFIKKIIAAFQFQEFQICLLQERQEIILSQFKGQQFEYVKYFIKNLSPENVQMNSLVQLLAHVIKHPSSEETINVILKYIYMFDDTLINKFNNLSQDQLGIIKQAIQLSQKNNILQSQYLLFVYKLTKIKVHIFFVENLQLSIETLTQETKQVYCIIQNLLFRNLYDYFGTSSADVIIKYFSIVNRIFELLHTNIEESRREKKDIIDKNTSVTTQQLNLIRLRYVMLVQKYLKQTFQVFKTNLIEINKKQEYREMYIIANKLQQFIRHILCYPGVVSVFSLQFVIESIIELYTNLNVSVCVGLYMLNHVYQNDLLGQLQFYEQFQEYEIPNKVIEVLVEYFVKNSQENLIALLHYVLSELRLINESTPTANPVSNRSFDMQGLANILNIIYNNIHSYIDTVQLSQLSQNSVVQFNLTIMYIFDLINSQSIQMNVRLLLNKLIIKLIDNTKIQLLTPQITQFTIKNMLNDAHYILGQNNYCQFNLDNLKLSDNTQLRPLTITIDVDEYKNVASFRDRINEIVGNKQYEYQPISLEALSYILWQFIEFQIENKCLNLEILHTYVDLLPIILTGRNLNLRYYTLLQLSEINNTSTQVLLYIQSHKRITQIILGLKHQVQLGALQNEINTKQTIQINRMIQKQQHAQQGQQQDIQQIYSANQQQIVYLTLQQLLYNDNLENNLSKSYLLNSVYFTNSISTPITYNQFKYLYELSEKPLQMQAMFLQNYHALNFINLSQLSYQVLGRLGSCADNVQMQQQVYQFKDSDVLERMQFLKMSKKNDADNLMNYTIMQSKQVEFEVSICSLHVIQSFNYFFSQQLFYHGLDDDPIRRQQIKHYCNQVEALLEIVFTQRFSDDEHYVFNAILLLLYYCIFKRYSPHSHVVEKFVEKIMESIPRVIQILLQIAISNIHDDYICYTRHVAQNAVEVCLFIIQRHQINVDEIFQYVLSCVQLQQDKIIQLLMIINYYKFNRVQINIDIKDINQYTTQNLNERLNIFTVGNNFVKRTIQQLQIYCDSPFIQGSLQDAILEVQNNVNLCDMYSGFYEYLQMYRYALCNEDKIKGKQVIANIEKTIVQCLNNNDSYTMMIIFTSLFPFQYILQLLNKVNNEELYVIAFNIINLWYYKPETNEQLEAPFEVVKNYLNQQFQNQLTTVESVKKVLETVNLSQFIKDDNELLLAIVASIGITNLGNNVEAFQKDAILIVNSYIYPNSEQKPKRGPKKHEPPKETQLEQATLYLHMLLQTCPQNMNIMRQILQQFILLSQNDIQIQLNLQYTVQPEHIIYYILHLQYLQNDPIKIGESLIMLYNLLNVYPLVEGIDMKNIVVNQPDSVYNILSELPEYKLKYKEQNTFKKLLFEFVFMSLIQNQQEDMGEILSDITQNTNQLLEQQIYKILQEKFGYEENELNCMQLIYLHKSYKFQEFDRYLAHLIKNDKLKLVEVKDLVQVVENLKECCQNNGILYCAKMLNEINKKMQGKSNDNVKQILTIFDVSRYYLEQIVEQQKNATLYNSQQEFTETNLATIATTTALTYKQEGDQEIVEAIFAILNTSQYYERTLIYNKIIILLNDLLQICENQFYSQKSHAKQPSLWISMIIRIIMYVLINIGEKQELHIESSEEEIKIAHSYQECLVEMLTNILNKFPEDMLQLTYKCKVFPQSQNDAIHYEFNIPSIFQSKKEYIKSVEAKSAFIKMFATHGIQTEMLQIVELTHQNMIPDVKFSLSQQFIYQYYRTKLIITLIKSYFGLINSMLNIYNISLCLTHFYANQEEFLTGETLFLQTFQNIGENQPQEDQFNVIMKQLYQQICIFVQMAETIKHSIEILLDLWRKEYRIEQPIIQFMTQICFLFLNFMPPCVLEPAKVLVVSEKVMRPSSNEIRIGNSVFKDLLSNNPTSNIINVFVSSLLAVHDSTGQLLEYNVDNQLDQRIDDRLDEEQLNQYILGEFLTTELLQSMLKFEAPPYTGPLKDRVVEYLRGLQQLDTKNMKVSKVVVKTPSGVEKEITVSSDQTFSDQLQRNFNIIADLEAMIPYNFSLSGAYLAGYLQNAYLCVVQQNNDETIKKLIQKANSRVNQWELLNNVSHYRNPMINEELCASIERIHQAFVKESRKSVTLRLGTNQIDMKTSIKQVIQCLGDQEIYKHFITQKRPHTMQQPEFQQKIEKLIKDFQTRLQNLQKLYQGESRVNIVDSDLQLPFAELLEFLHTGQIQFGQKQSINCLISCLFLLRQCQQAGEVNYVTSQIIIRAFQLNSDLCAFLYLRLMKDVFSRVERLSEEQVKALNEKTTEVCNCTYGPYMHTYQLSEQNLNILQVQKTILIMLQSTSQTIVAQRINLHALNTKALINDNIFGFDNYILVQLADNYQAKPYSSETTHQAIIQQIKSTFSNNKDLGFTKRWLYNFTHHLPAMSPNMHLSFEGAPDQMGHENIMLINRLFYKNQAHTEAHDYGSITGQVLGRSAQHSSQRSKEQQEGPQIQVQLRALYQKLSHAHNTLSSTEFALNRFVTIEKLLCQPLLAGPGDEQIKKFTQPAAIAQGSVTALYYEGFLVLNILYQNLYSYILTVYSQYRINEQLKANVEAIKVQINDIDTHIQRQESESKRTQKDIKELENQYKTFQHEQHKRWVDSSTENSQKQAKGTEQQQSSQNQDLETKIRKLREQNEQLTREQSQSTKKIEKYHADKFIKQYELITSLMSAVHASQPRDTKMQTLCNQFIDLFKCYELYYQLNVQENQIINHQFQCEKIAQRVLMGLYEQIGEEPAAFGLMYPTNVRCVGEKLFAVTLQSAPKLLFEINTECYAPGTNSSWYVNQCDLDTGAGPSDSQTTKTHRGRPKAASSSEQSVEAVLGAPQYERWTMWHDRAPSCNPLPLDAPTDTLGGFVKNRAWFSWSSIAGDVQNSVLNESFLRSQPPADYFAFAFWGMSGQAQNALNKIQKADLASGVNLEGSGTSGASGVTGAEELTQSVYDRCRKAVRRLCTSAVRPVIRSPEVFPLVVAALKTGPMLDSRILDNTRMRQVDGRMDRRPETARELHKAENSRALLVILERETFANQTFNKILENLLESQQIQEIDQIAKDLRDEYIKKQYKEAQPQNQFRQQISRFKIFMDATMRKVKDLNTTLFPGRHSSAKTTADEWLARIITAIDPAAVAGIAGATAASPGLATALPGTQTIGTQQSQQTASTTVSHAQNVQNIQNTQNNQIHPYNSVGQNVQLGGGQIGGLGSGSAGLQLNNSAICQAIAVMNSSFPGYRPEFSGLFLPGNSVYASILNNVIENEEVRSTSDDFTKMYTSLYESPDIDYDELVDYRLSRKVFEQFAILSWIAPSVGPETVLKLGLLRRSLGAAIRSEKGQDERFCGFKPAARLSCGDVAYLSPILIFEQQRFAPSAAAPGLAAKFIDEAPNNKFQDYELLGYESYIQQLQLMLQSFDARASSVCGTETVFRQMRGAPHARLQQSFQGAAALTQHRLPSLFLLTAFALLLPAENDGLIQKLILLLRDSISTSFRRNLLTHFTGSYATFWVILAAFQAQKTCLVAARNAIEAGAAPEIVAEKVMTLLAPIIQAFQAQYAKESDIWNDDSESLLLEPSDDLNHQIRGLWYGKPPERYKWPESINHSGRDASSDATLKMLLINALQTCLSVPGVLLGCSGGAQGGRAGRRPQLVEEQLLTGEYGALRQAWRLLRPRLVRFRLQTVNDLVRQSLQDGQPLGALGLGREASLIPWRQRQENRVELTERHLLLSHAAGLAGNFELARLHATEAENMASELRQLSSEGLRAWRVVAEAATHAKVTQLTSQAVALRLGHIADIDERLMRELLTKAPLSRSQLLSLAWVAECRLGCAGGPGTPRIGLQGAAHGQQLAQYADMLFLLFKDNGPAASLAFHKFFDLFLLPTQQKSASDVEQIDYEKILMKYVKFVAKVDPEVILSELDFLVVILTQEINCSVSLACFVAGLIIVAAKARNNDPSRLLAALCTLLDAHGIVAQPGTVNTLTETELKRYVYSGQAGTLPTELEVLAGSDSGASAVLEALTKLSEATGSTADLPRGAARRLAVWAAVSALCTARGIAEMLAEIATAMETCKLQDFDFLAAVLKQSRTRLIMRPFTADKAVEVLRDINSAIDSLEKQISYSVDQQQLQELKELSIQAVDDSLRSLEAIVQAPRRLAAPLQLTFYEEDYMPRLPGGNGAKESFSGASVPVSSVGPRGIRHDVLRRRVRYVATRFRVDFVQNYPLVHLLARSEEGGDERSVFIIHTAASGVPVHFKTIWQTLFPGYTVKNLLASQLVNGATYDLFRQRSAAYRLFPWRGAVMRHQLGAPIVDLQPLHGLSATAEDFCHLFHVQKRLATHVARHMVRAQLFGLQVDGANILQNYCYAQSFDERTGDVFDLLEEYCLPLTPEQLHGELSRFVTLVSGLYGVQIGPGGQTGHSGAAQMPRCVVDRVTVQRLHPHVLLGYAPQALGLLLKDLGLKATVGVGLSPRLRCSYDQTQVAAGCLDADAIALAWERIATPFYFLALVCQVQDLGGPDAQGERLQACRDAVFNAVHVTGRVLDLLADKQDEKRLMRFFGINMLGQQIQRAYMPFAVEWVAHCIATQWG